MASIDRVIERKIQEMPPLPQSAQALLDRMGNPERCMDDLVKVVECDGPLTVRILAVANSSVYALPAPVESLAHALSYLGERTALGVALSDGVGSLYATALKGYQEEGSELWATGLRCALAARPLTNHVNPPVDPGLAYTAGLLLDIGKLILSDALEGKLDRYLESVQAGSAGDLAAAEREALGTDHCQVGLQLASHWGLSDALRQAIAHHHCPADAPAEHRPLVFVVHVAAALALLMGEERAVEDLAMQIDPTAKQYLELGTEMLSQCMEETLFEYEKTAAAMSAE